MREPYAAHVNPYDDGIKMSISEIIDMKNKQQIAELKIQLSEAVEDRDNWKLTAQQFGDQLYALKNPSSPATEALPIDDAIPTADGILDRASGHMRDRAATYDAARGERSMGKVAAIARVLYAEQLGRGEFSEEMAWGLQVVLKLVRSSQGGYRADNYEDMAAYSALMGESAGREATRAE